MVIDDAYRTCKRLKLTKSHQTFSADFLSRRPRHYDDLLCSGRTPSVAVMIVLILRLQTISRLFSENPNLRTHAVELDGLLARLWADLEGRCVMALPRGRPAMPRNALYGSLASVQHSSVQRKRAIADRPVRGV